jgi:hypothetical protein
MWRKVSASVLASLLSSTVYAEEAQSIVIVQCFAAVRARGKLDQIELSINRMSQLLSFSSRFITRIDAETVELRTIVYVVGPDRIFLRNLLSETSLKKMFAETGTGDAVEAQYLGCADQKLQP